MPLSLYRRGAIWHFRGTVAGRRLRGSCRTSIKEIAQRVAAETEAREWKRHLDGPGAVLTFAQAALIYREAGKPTRFLERIEDHWKDTPVRQITAGTIRASCDALYPDAAAATRNRQVIVPTQAIINFAAERDLCQPIRMRRFPVVTREKEPATWEWIQTFMAHASPHLGALACFMFLTGARISEALAMTWGDVDLAAGRARIMQTKIGAERRAHLPPAAVVAIANIPGDRVGRVFGYSSRDTAKPPWRNAVARAGIKPLSYHACRHGFATAALQAGIDPVTVARLGGWKSAQHVFSTYGHAMADDTVTNRLTDTQRAQPVPINSEKPAKTKA